MLFICYDVIYNTIELFINTMKEHNRMILINYNIIV